MVELGSSQIFALRVLNLEVQLALRNGYDGFGMRSQSLDYDPSSWSRTKRSRPSIDYTPCVSYAETFRYILAVSFGEFCMAGG
jgi:hypothetical protein